MDAETIQNRKEIVKGWLSRTLLNAGSNGIPVAQIAEAMGVSEASVYKYASTSEENLIHLHNLLPLIQETQDFFILEELARTFGFALISISDPLVMLKTLVKALEE